ncbi:hypothetical protein pdam_00011912 [Pocillopora damicornis]|uniref:Uncharacterized protein n=1 Tax=Pocillopora damicornis TaxID=46731 RepID=A0A3M6V0F2_POCDA|nr:hypothetical protein pdam_00011912 [Pocillopora damicornis]
MPRNGIKGFTMAWYLSAAKTVSVRVDTRSVTIEAAKSTIWEGTLDWNEVHRCEQQSGYVCSGHVDKKVIGCRLHATEAYYCSYN